MKPAKSPPPPPTLKTRRHAFERLDQALEQNTEPSGFTADERLNLIRIKVFGRLAENRPQT